MSSETTVIVVAVLVVVLIVGSIAAAFFLFAPFSQINRVSSGPGPVQVTDLFLAIIYPNSADSYFGSAYRLLYIRGISGPFYFQHGEVFQTNFTLPLGGTLDHTVDSMTPAFSGGFNLQSTSPTTPITVTHGSTITFTATLQAPYSDYRGPVTIDLYTH